VTADLWWPAAVTVATLTVVVLTAYRVRRPRHQLRTATRARLILRGPTVAHRPAAHRMSGRLMPRAAR
jgi:hypothetical protein